MKRFFLLLLWISGCARAPLKDPAKAFFPASRPQLRDTYSIESLRDALKKTLTSFEKSATIPSEFQFGERKISRENYRRALEALLPEMEDFDRFHSFVDRNFEFYEVYGNEAKGEVFSTGYYDPLMRGSRKAVQGFSEPIYRTPPDLVAVDLKAYAEKSPDFKPLQNLVVEMKSKTPSWKGRLLEEKGSRKVVPYFRRSEIQRQRPLAGKGLEIVYLDPIDAFFLEIEGSGLVILENGKKIRVGYDSANGAPYTAIGKFLLPFIPKEQMSMQRIRKHLETLNRDQQQELFDKNESYVFFRELDSGSLTFSGAEVTPMRTIASDSFLFPKGTLGFLEIELQIGRAHV